MKISEYVVCEGEVNIRNYLEGGYQPYGNPMLKSNGGATNQIIQVMVKSEEPVAEVKTTVDLAKKTPSKPNSLGDKNSM